MTQLCVLYTCPQASASAHSVFPVELGKQPQLPHSRSGTSTCPEFQLALYSYMPVFQIVLGFSCLPSQILSGADALRVSGFFLFVFWLANLPCFLLLSVFWSVLLLAAHLHSSPSPVGLSKHGRRARGSPSLFFPGFILIHIAQTLLHGFSN